MCSSIHPLVKRAGVAVAAVVLVWLAVAGALAQDPPDKEDSKISPLLRELLASAQESVAAAQQSQAADVDGAVTRDALVDRAELKSAPPADEPQDELIRVDAAGNVQVYLYMDSTSEEALAELRELDARIEIVNARWGVIQAWIPTTALDDFAALDVVDEVTLPDYAVTRAGSATSEGDAIHRASLVRAWSELNGAGVKVGVISDGVDSMSDSQLLGDLPAMVEIDPNLPGDGDEGTALLEIVHDLAPGASLAFSGPSGSLEMVEAIDWLANDAFGGAGADIIVDDLGFHREPYFEDGAVALAAADAVAGGAVFVSAGGNLAQRHYEAEFVDGGDGFHAFAPNDTAMAIATGFVLVSPGSVRGRVTAILQWSDRWGAAATDYDLFVCVGGWKPTKFNLQNGRCVGSTRIQDGDDRPYERAVVNLPAGSTADLYIHRYTAGTATRLELFVITGSIKEHGVPAGGIFGHPAVAGVIATGAIGARDLGHDQLEAFSDYGASEIYFPARETRRKPDLIGIDGVAITGGGGFPSPFYGTSAAAPHVAGVAALVLEATRIAEPTLSKKAAADQVFDTLTATAVDLGEQGFDDLFGFGRADALAAVASTGQLSATTFTVDSTGDGADSDTTDGDCDDGNGACTLRAAIQQANAGVGGIIEFGIGGAGPHTIQPASALPTISKPVFLDGLSQPGASVSSILIELDGTNAGTTTNGLTVAASDSWIRGLAINRFGAAGIVVQTAGAQVIEHNRIGTNPGGATDQGNGGVGVSIVGVARVQIRNNVISGNGSHGVSVSGSGAQGTLVTDSVIGTDASGTVDLGNDGAGVYIANAVVSEVRRNVISGNGSHGVSLSAATDTVILANSIGTARDGVSALGNTGSGVHIGSGATDNTVDENTIAFNGADGVTIDSSTAVGNTVWENAIHSNAGLGIDLGPDGVTANDVGDGDAGANGLKNFPVLTTAGRSGDEIGIVGRLDSTSSTRFIVDFYSNASCDASGYGEGQAWLGYSVIVTGSGGTTTFEASTLDGTINSAQTPVGNFITATATQAFSANSSEFSACIEAAALPLLNLSERTVEVTEGSTATYMVALTAAPADTVTVSPVTADATVATVLPSALTFETGTWNIAQPVTVTGVADNDLWDEASSIGHSVAIGTSTFSGRSVLVEVSDDDAPALILTNSDFEAGVTFDYLSEMTEGATATYTVAPATQPAADLTVELSSSDDTDLTVAPSSLTFSTSTWRSAQTVRLTALSDDSAAHTRAVITHETTIGDRDYVLARLAVDVADPDRPELTFAPTIGNVNEGQTATLTARLEAEPSGSLQVLLGLTDSGALIVWPTRLDFTVDNWSTGETLTLIGAVDADDRDETVLLAALTLLGSSLARIGDVSVTVSDRDLPALELSRRRLDVDEGATATYTVELEEEPSSGLSVSVTSTDTDEATVDPATLSFTTNTWDDPQIVTVTGVADSDTLTEQVQIRHGATIGGQNYVLATVTTTVNEVSLPPSFTDGDSTVRSVAENSPGGTHVGAPVAAVDPNGDRLFYDISGDHVTLFDFASGSGQISVAVGTELDYETQDSYQFVVEAKDPSGNFDSIAVTIELTNELEAGTVSLSSPQPLVGVALTATLTDPDGSLGDLSWVWARSTDRSTWTTISGARSASYTPAVGDLGNVLRATVSYSDGHGPNLVDENAEAVSLNAVVTAPTSNNAPAFPATETRSRSVVENTPAGDPIGAAVAATDADNEPLTYTLSGSDSGSFEIVESSGQLLTDAALDYDTKTSYSVTVTVSDPLGAGESIGVTILVIDLNETPVVTGDTAPKFAETTSGVVARYRATDPERRAVSWSLGGPDRTDLEINSVGVLRFRSPPDFEAGIDADRDSVYVVTVEASDDVNTGTLEVTVEVTDVNEPPVVSGRSDVDHEENRGGVLEEFRVADPENQAIEWTPAGADGGAFEIDDGKLSFVTPPDFEAPTDSGHNNRYSVTVEVSDGTHTARFRVSVNVTNVNEAPEFPAGTTTREIREDAAPGARIGAAVAATDPERDRLTYTLRGADATFFEIDESSARLQTKDWLNYEARAAYDVTVWATEPSGFTDTIDVTIDIINVDEAGSVSFSADGDAIQATLDDRDGGVTGETWQWARSANRHGGWADISGARSARYTRSNADAGMYLQARVSYEDAHGSGKRAQGVSSNEIPAPDIRVAPLVSGLSIPWGLAFTPDGTMLFTQRAGVLSSRLADGTVRTVTADLSDLYTASETRFMAIVVDPNFRSNRRFYTCQGHTGPEVQVIAWTIDASYTVATRVADPLVGGLPTASTHGGCRLRFGPQGYLWIATGDGRTGTVPQDLTSLGGKVLRVDATTGEPARGNPIASSRIYTYGHRNVQGLALRPGTNQMWSVEHGPTEDDEINLLAAGRNYGWDPVPGYNQNVAMTDLVKFPGAVEARWSSGSPTLAPSGAIFLEGAHWGVWEGWLAVATLKDSKLRLFEFDRDGALVSQVIVAELDGRYGRLRTPMMGPDGALYVTTSNGGGNDQILRIAENQAPAFPAGPRPERSVAENSGPGVNIGEPVEATDADGDELSYMLGGADAESFEIAADSGQLLTRGALDYERRSSYRVTVTAADTSGKSAVTDVTIRIINEDEDGALTFSSRQPQVGTPLTATLSDPDGSTRSIGWLWERRVSGGSIWSPIVGAVSGSYAPGDGDLGSDLRVTTSYTDGQGPGKSVQVLAPRSVHAAPLMNRAPAFPDTESGERSVDENTPAGRNIGAMVSALDPDNHPLTYRWSGGGAAIFELIESANGMQLRTKEPLDHEGRDAYTFSVTASDPSLETDTLTVIVTVNDVNEPPEFPPGSETREVLAGDASERPVGSPVAAADPDIDDVLSYLLGGPDAGSFTIDAASGQVLTNDPLALGETHEVTVTATDRSGRSASVDVMIRVVAQVVSRGGGGGGGGGGGPPPVPIPSEVDFEWNVTRDIESLDDDNDLPTGLWSNGETLWVIENSAGGADALFAYDLESGERRPGHEFALDSRNRFSHGVWSDRETLWVADSGQDRLFAYDLAGGERLVDRDLELDERNRDPRGIWSDRVIWYVLDSVKRSLFAYDVASGELLAEYALDRLNRSPRGIWSDGVTIWVSDDGAKRLFAYRVEGDALTRIEEEEFSFRPLLKAGNGAPRGIWSDGEVVFVVDEQDDHVYTYNLPDAIDPRLASLALSDVEIGEFDSYQTEYVGVAGAGVTETTIEARAAQPGATVVIEAGDATRETDNANQIDVTSGAEVTITVTSEDGSRRRVYRVEIGPPPSAVTHIELRPGDPTDPIPWPGLEGISIADALRGVGDPAANDIFDKVTHVFTWDWDAEAWRIYVTSPRAQAVPGLRTLATLRLGAEYWVNVTEPVTWIVATGGS